MSTAQFPEKAIDIYAHMIGYNSKKETFDLKASAAMEIEPYIGMARLMREKLDVKKPKQADAVMAQLVAVIKDSKDSSAAHLAAAHLRGPDIFRIILRRIPNGRRSENWSWRRLSNWPPRKPT